MIKRLPLAVLVATLVTIAGCSSTAKLNVVEPDIILNQLVGPSDLGYPGGLIEVRYEMQVANRDPHPITLKRVEIQSISGGAYRLRREAFPYDITIQPGGATEINFWMRALQAGTFGRGSNEPVTIRGVVYFNSPAGAFQKMFIRELSQF